MKKSPDRKWRKIVRRDTTYEEKTSFYRGFSWRRTEVHTLTLECGHTQQRRGSYCPTTEVICKDCEAGKRRKKVKAEPGVFDHRHGSEIECPIARALIRNATAKAKAS